MFTTGEKRGSGPKNGRGPIRGDTGGVGKGKQKNVPLDNP